jgi:ATP-dependent protease HslVU (ClpYQ) peptidase subunit
MENNSQLPQMTPGERETESEANRLMEQLENALAIVAVRSNDDGHSLEALADRIERASHDLASAIRELARERRTDGEEN